MTTTTEPSAERRWYAQPDDLIGGWCVADVNRPPSTFVDPPPGAPPTTGRCIASFTDQAAARRIAALHNADLDRRSARVDLAPKTSPHVQDVSGRLCGQRLADVVVDLAGLALAFGRIDRTAVYHPDGLTPESDTDHTVMLVWVACALAARYFPSLDVGLVAQFAAVHDAPEVYAGDTQTLRIDTAGRAAKANREQAAAARLRREFADVLPWLPDTIDRYEAQQEPEARFVRGVDKVLPKAVHLLDGAAGLREFGIDRTELRQVLDRQGEDMRRYVGEFTELLALRTELVDRVLAADLWAHPTTHDAATPTSRYSPPDSSAGHDTPDSAATAPATVDDHAIRLIRLAIRDPGTYTPRDHTAAESVPAWATRAVLKALADNGYWFRPRPTIPDHRTTVGDGPTGRTRPTCPSAEPTARTSRTPPTAT